MKRFFEYYFYRIAKLNFKKDYEIASASVTGVQFIIIINVLLFFYLLLGLKDNLSEKGDTVISCIIGFVLFTYNYRLYNGKYKIFDDRWGNDSGKKKIIGMIKVILFILFSCSLFFVNGLIFHLFEKTSH
jgi:hypothetical protein